MLHHLIGDRKPRRRVIEGDVAGERRLAREHRRCGVDGKYGDRRRRSPTARGDGRHGAVRPSPTMAHPTTSGVARAAVTLLIVARLATTISRANPVGGVVIHGSLVAAT